MKKIGFSITLFTLVLFALNGCVPSENKVTDQTKSPLQKITVLLDWFPNTNHTGLYVAQNKGYYQENGLDVSFIQPEEGLSNQLVATGKAEFAVSSQESVTQARAADIPVVSIAAIIQHNTSAFASLKNANINSVKDFENKKYGGWGSPIEEAVLTAVMHDANADFKKVKNITIGTTDFFATIGKEADFQWIFYGWDGIEAERRKIPLNLIFLSDLNPILDYYTPVLITSEDQIKNHRDLVKKFMDATAKGYEFSIAHPDESAEILLKAAPELNADLLKKSQVWLSPRYKAEATQWGIQKASVWQGYADWLQQKNLIPKMIEVDKAFTNDFLP